MCCVENKLFFNLIEYSDNELYLQLQYVLC